MPALRTYDIFISHAWSHHEQYDSVVRRFESTPNFAWHNLSVPKHDPLLAGQTEKLEGLLRDQMRPAHAFVILGGMYAAHSDWIEFEVNFARRIGRPIIGVRPHGNVVMPRIVQDNATKIVGWQAGSIVGAIRELGLAEGV